MTFIQIIRKFTFSIKNTITNINKAAYVYLDNDAFKEDNVIKHTLGSSLPYLQADQLIFLLSRLIHHLVFHQNL